MKCLLGLVAYAALCFGADGGSAAGIGRAIQEAGLDPDECYRVRDFAFQKEDIKFYLNEGHLMFARPVEGRRLAAVFVADGPGGDAELMVLPPHTSERLSLASFTKSPNLNEHFVAAVFLFTDNTAAELLGRLRDAKKSPDAALLIRDQFDPVLRNLAQSYQLRLVRDMLSEQWAQNGLFFAALSGKTLGNFDVVYDPQANEQIVVGQMVFREERRFFDIWTSFRSRSVRNGARKRSDDPLVFRNYAIDAVLSSDLNLKVKTTIDIATNVRSDRAILFDLSRRMRVNEVKLNGQPAEYFAQESLRLNLVRSAENDAFLVILPKPLEPGEAVKLEISHEGKVIASSGNGVYYVAARSNWYPIHEGVFATYDLSFQYPKNLQLVSSGDIVEERTLDNSRLTRRRVNSAIRFAGFNLGDYEKASVTRAGFTIDVYANRKAETALHPRSREVLPPPTVPIGRNGRPRLNDPAPVMAPPMPPDPKARLRELADEIGGAMEFLSAKFGPPPLKTLTVSPIPGAFGQGFPGLLYLSTLAYLDPSELPLPVRTDSQRRFFTELLHSHEAAHQWWGNLVTSGSYQDDWLMEALANYSALLVLERRKGRKALESVLDEYRDRLLMESEGKRIESAGPIVWGTRLNSSQSSNAWRIIMYEKGAWIIHMLRVKMGDAAFSKMLNALAQRNRFQRITTDGFRLLAAEFLPAGSDDKKLETFFEQWVYGTGIPTLKLSHTIRGKAPKARIQGSISQSDVNEDFSVAVPVEIHLPGKKVVTKWIQTSNDPATFTLDLPQAPGKVLIDPYAVLMRR